MGLATQHGPRPTSGPLSQVSCVIVSGSRAALDLDKYTLRNLIRPRCGERLVEVSQCILAFSLVFMPYLSNKVVSAKSSHYFSCPCSTEAFGIAHKPPRSLYRQTHSTTTVTLAAHARRGLITAYGVTLMPLILERNKKYSIKKCLSIILRSLYLWMVWF